MYEDADGNGMLMRAILLFLTLWLSPALALGADPTLPTANVDITTGWFELNAGGGTTRNVSDMDGLNTAIAAAACGDEIVITAGTEIVVDDFETFDFTDKGCADASPIIVRSSGEGSLPARGVRISPSDVANMAKFSRNVNASNDPPLIRINYAADNWWFVGLEFEETNTVEATAPQVALILVGYEGSTIGTGANKAERTIFDRVYVHGSTTGQSHDGFTISGDNIAIINSYIDEIHSKVGDGGHGYQLVNSDGPFLVDNNYIAVSGINLFHGDNSIVDKPINITITRNYIRKYDKWNSSHDDYAGIAWFVKNHIEFKSGLRALVEGNYFFNMWAAQQIHSVVLTPRATDVDDLTFRFNIWEKVLIIANINATDETLNNVLFNDNLAFEVGGASSKHMVLGKGAGGVTTNFILRHNTFIGTDSLAPSTVMFGETEDSHTTWIVKDNIIDARAEQLEATDNTGLNAWKFIVTNEGADGDWDNNVPIEGFAALWQETPASNFQNHFLTAVADVDFVGGATIAGLSVVPDDYALNSASIHAAGNAKDATDGLDMGADIALLKIKTQGAKSGVWGAAWANPTWPSVSWGSPSWPSVLWIPKGDGSE